MITKRLPSQCGPGRPINPALPTDIDGVVWRNFPPSRRQLAQAGRFATRLPCPWRRQHAVCSRLEDAQRLDRLFAGQRAKLRRETGLPYVEDQQGDAFNDALFAGGKATALVDLRGWV